MNAIEGESLKKAGRTSLKHVLVIAMAGFRMHGMPLSPEVTCVTRSSL